MSFHHENRHACETHINVCCQKNSEFFEFINFMSSSSHIPCTETFLFSGGKVKTERKYKNENENLQNDFMQKQKQKQNGVF